MSTLNTIKQQLRNVRGFMFARSGIARLANQYLRKKSVAMLHTGRCGSTVLANMLNAHSKVFWAGEIFEKFMKGDQTQAVSLRDEISLSRNRYVSEIYGFETKYLPQQHLSYRCLNLRLEEYLLLLRELGFDYFIVLHRKNYLRRALSAQAGRQRGGQWHSSKKAESATKVHLDIESFRTGVRQEPLLELFSSIDESYNFLRSNLSENSLFLTYEDDILDDPQLAYRKVCEFLELEVEAPKIHLKRTNPFSYEEIILNLEEVRDVLKNTKYAWMLDD